MRLLLGDCNQSDDQCLRLTLRTYSSLMCLAASYRADQVSLLSEQLEPSAALVQPQSNAPLSLCSPVSIRGL